MTAPAKLTRLAKVAALLAAPALLAGCSALSALEDASTPLEVYELRAPADIPRVRGRAAPRDVIVEVPTTSGALSTDRIMIRPNALQAQYLPDVRWADPVPVMVQTLMLRAIETTNAVRYVGRKPLAASGDYALITEVVDFQAELNEGGESATVEMELIIRVVRERDAAIVASRTFQSEALAATTETPVVAAAFNVASDALFAEIATWVAGVVR